MHKTRSWQSSGQPVVQAWLLSCCAFVQQYSTHNGGLIMLAACCASLRGSAKEH